MRLPLTILFIVTKLFSIIPPFFVIHKHLCLQFVIKYTNYTNPDILSANKGKTYNGDTSRDKGPKWYFPIGPNQLFIVSDCPKKQLFPNKRNKKGEIGKFTINFYRFNYSELIKSTVCIKLFPVIFIHVWFVGMYPLHFSLKLIVICVFVSYF